MHPVKASVSIGRPREEVFRYLADIANHPEFTDHFLKDWHLTREDTIGEGAGARFRMTIPANRFPWADITFAEVAPSRKLVARGRTGKFNRVQLLSTYELDELSGGSTRVTYTFETHPKKLTDRLLESLGARVWIRRKLGRAMRRLQAILEEGEQRGTRATIAGGARKPASQFRFIEPVK